MKIVFNFKCWWLCGKRLQPLRLHSLRAESRPLDFDAKTNELIPNSYSDPCSLLAHFQRKLVPCLYSSSRNESLFHPTNFDLDVEVPRRWVIGTKSVGKVTKLPLIVSIMGDTKRGARDRCCNHNSPSFPAGRKCGVSSRRVRNSITSVLDPADHG